MSADACADGGSSQGVNDVVMTTAPPRLVYLGSIDFAMAQVVSRANGRPCVYEEREVEGGE